MIHGVKTGSEQAEASALTSESSPSVKTDDRSVPNSPPSGSLPPRSEVLSSVPSPQPSTFHQDAKSDDANPTEFGPDNIGILAYGSLLSDLGDELEHQKITALPLKTPWPIEYARSSKRRGGGPTLVIYDGGEAVNGAVVVLKYTKSDISTVRKLLAEREETSEENIKVTKALGLETVLYAHLRDNIVPAQLTPKYLAELAIDSVAKKPELNGIRYLSDNLKRGIVTPLTKAYEEAILSALKAEDLEAAERIAKGRLRSQGSRSPGAAELGGAGRASTSQSSPAPSVARVGREPEGPVEDAKAAADGYRQEIRFAIVMYGGVSLAIYIHGVAQELLRLARATSAPEKELDEDPVAQIYRKLSPLVRDQRQERSHEHCPTRFVIDILSGTSAGGINAIFLAKALTIGSQTLENLRQTWLDVADMNQLLNTGGLFEPKRSLLRGDWMYSQLYKAFDMMNREPKDPPSPYKSERLDLFVTTTDLNGATVPIRLADMDVLEKVHKGCFNFRTDKVTLTSGDKLDQELSIPELAHNDFCASLDPMLAFAARCTSSFPVAFAPMKLVDIKSDVSEDTYARDKKKYESFFRWVPQADLYPQSCKDLDRRELADGGYLDNKPFGHAIDAMTFRASKLPHTRKLLYVDPFPEVAADDECHPHFNFIQNGLAAASSLPRYQTIREEIARVEFSNLTQERLQQLRDRVNESLKITKGGAGHAEDFRKTLNETIVGADEDGSRQGFEKTKLSELIAQFGTQYATYHQVRLMDVTSDLARIVSATHETAQSQDFYLAIRYLVRAWHEDGYDAEGGNGKKFESQFFTEFDYSFRLRRAIRLLEWAQQDLPAVCESLIEQITRLLRMRERLSLPDRDLNPVWKEITKALDLSWDNIKEILEPVTDEARHQKAQHLYKSHRQSLDAIATAIKAEWDRVFGLNRTLLKPLLRKYKSLNDRYQLFDFDDMTSLAFLEGSNVSEHTTTEVYRVSPVDGIDRELDKKLAGYALWDFGAFLEKEWRLNDMLWGRLDAAERIVSAVLNDPRDRACRDGFIQTIRQTIVEQEAERWARLNPALKAIHDGTLVPYLEDKYELAEPPPPAQRASQIAKAADILGRMLEEDAGIKNSATQKLQGLAKIAVGVIAFLVPGGLPRVFLNYWLELLGVMSFLVFLAGRFAKNDNVKQFGLYGLVGTVLLAILAWFFGTLLAKKSADDKRLPGQIVRFLKWLPALVVTSLVLLGCWHFREDWHRFWQAISAIN